MLHHTQQTQRQTALMQKRRRRRLFKKRIRFVLFLLLSFALIFTMLHFLSSYMNRNNAACYVPVLPKNQMADAAQEPLSVTSIETEMRGIWIATVGNINYPKHSDDSTKEKQAQLDQILANCAQWNLNTVFFQVRPSADAFYNSDLFSVSKYFSEDGTLDFDPLAYLIREANKRNISVYAWVNPLRVTYGSTTIDSLPINSVAVQHPQWVVSYNGTEYFDPGLPEVRAYIAAGVQEIVSGYDVAGVVFDDYFYPYPATDSVGNSIPFDDNTSFAKYGNGIALADFRRENINSLVRAAYDAVKENNSQCVFGISPFGIWQNDNGTNGGSATSGLEAYQSLYCDALSWIQGGYIDFIAPQLYWSRSTEAAPFEALCHWWGERTEGSGVALYISHGAYRYSEWQMAHELTAQLQYARQKHPYRGSILYGYRAMCDDDFGVSKEATAVFSEARYYVSESSVHFPAN